MIFKPEDCKPLPHDTLSQRYLVSKSGQVLSLYDNKNRLRSIPKVRSTYVGSIGYESLYICATINGKKFVSRPLVHILVCTAFHGPKPSGQHQVAHLDGNPLNNSADNLKWVTKIENESHKKIHGTNLDRDKNHQTKLDTRMQKAIVYLLKNHSLTLADLGRAFGVSYHAISHAKKTFIEPIVKEECKHLRKDFGRKHGEPWAICLDCNVELKPEWKEVK